MCLEKYIFVCLFVARLSSNTKEIVLSATSIYQPTTRSPKNLQDDPVGIRVTQKSYRKKSEGI